MPVADAVPGLRGRRLDQAGFALGLEVRVDVSAGRLVLEVMKAASLVGFLNGRVSARQLQEEIALEVSVWWRKHAERGRSAPITLSGMTDSHIITHQMIIRLIDALITSELSSESFGYVVNAMLLSEHFHWGSESLREAVENLLIPEPTDGLAMQQVWRVRERLKGWEAG